MITWICRCSFWPIPSALLVCTYQMAHTQHLVATVPFAPLVPLAVSIQACMLWPMKIRTEESLSVSSILAQVLRTCWVLNVNGMTMLPFCLRLLVMALMHWSVVWCMSSTFPRVMNLMITTLGLNSYMHTYLMPSSNMLIQSNISNNYIPTIILCGGSDMPDEYWGNYSYPNSNTQIYLASVTITLFFSHRMLPFHSTMLLYHLVFLSLTSRTIG
jgi:hypothetical protein